MVTIYVNSYEIEATGEPLIGDERWGAYVSIFAPADNPVHLTTIYRKRRVAAASTFSSEEAAVTKARRIGTKILARWRRDAKARLPIEPSIAGSI